MKQYTMFKLVQDELVAVEIELASVIRSQDDLVTDIGGHLLQAGGKRLRPALYLLCAQRQRADTTKVISTAAAIELIHMATLVHDDVIDNATTRRGIVTANVRWGNHTSVLAGDYLFAKAFSLIARDADGESLRILTNVICEMCEGEITQTRDYFNTAQTEAEYLDRIGKKTASFLAASCQMGAIAAELDSTEAMLLHKYGYAMGMAFQITDDILDVTASSEQIGKPAGNDLREGVLTIPVIYALRTSTHKEELKKLIISKNVSDSDSQRCLAIIHETDAIEYSYRRAKDYLELAQKSLPDSLADDVRSSLIEIAEFISLRKY